MKLFHESNHFDEAFDINENYELRKYFLYKNLLITVKKASARIGEAIKIKDKEVLNEADSNKKATNKLPNKVLPTSPMKTFDGYQFQYKNPKSIAVMK